MSFEDHFSRLAQEYAAHRPGYPHALFAYLASLAPARDLAWDCGTGSGQAAIDLAAQFQHVVATDASAEQIARAFPHERVTYRVEPAEQTTFAAGTVALTTVGTAVHWFDFDAFYREVRRVSMPRAILAVWTYHLTQIDRAIDALIDHYYRHTLAGFWAERIAYLEARYQTLPFPFPEIEPPPFEAHAQWTLDDLLGFLSSWSGTRNYLEERGSHPLLEILDPLQQAWGDPQQERLVRWPLHLRVGRLSPDSL